MEDKRLAAFARLLDVMDELREKCPWDKEQTTESLRNNTIEETYELADAISLGDMEGVREELGDLMLHIVFYSKIGSEQGVFNITDVLDGICDKLIYRHPHVFGKTDADTPGKVMRNWEQLKLREKQKKNRPPGVLSGVPRSLPAMVKALRVSEKAANAGFDWKKREDIWAKVKEETTELETEINGLSHKRLEHEFGDLLFSLINAARLYGIDPELALEKTNKRFIERFGYIEKMAERQGKSLSKMTLDAMDELWEEAKKVEAAAEAE